MREKIKENKLFFYLNISFVIIFIATFICSLIDKFVWCIDWKDYNIDLLCEIIASATFFVGSIIGIAIPLQKEKLYGVSSQDFNKLREQFRYSVTLIIVISIVLSALNGIFIAVEMMFACLGLSFISITFCVYISFLEIPLMMGQEKRLIKIVRKFVHNQLSNPKPLPYEGMEVLKWLTCCEKTFKETFDLLKKDDSEFNEKLIITLLEVQEQQAFELNKIEDKEKQRRIASALKSNMKDILYFSVDLTYFFKDSTKNHSYRVTRVLFRLEELPEFSKITRDLVINSVNYYDFLENQAKKDFIMSVVLPMILHSVTSGNFGFAKAMRRLLSEREIVIGNENVLSLITSLMSLHFFYLCDGAHDVSEDLKKKIYDFMSFDGIEDNTKIIPWKQLFLKHIERYNVNFQELLRCYHLSEHNWDVTLRNTEAHFVILSTGYVLQWYLTCLFHSFSVWNFDFNSLLINDEVIYLVKSIGDNIFASQEKPQLTEQMRKMATFYGLNNDLFTNFEVNEEREHKFFNVVNSLHIDDLKTKQIRSQNVNIDDVVAKYEAEFKKHISSEWGYNSALEINSQPRFLYLLLEKYSDAVNYDEAIVNSILNSAYRELLKNMTIHIISKDKDFDHNIGELMKKGIKSLTDGVQYSLPYYISDGELKEKVDSSIESSNKINSRIFIGDYIFTDNSFSFNCKLNISWRELRPEEISRQADSCKRADGQYVYEGALIAREELEQYINDQYYILEVQMQFAINLSPNSLYKIILFPKNN